MMSTAPPVPRSHVVDSDPRRAQGQAPAFGMYAPVPQVADSTSVRTPIYVSSAPSLRAPRAVHLGAQIRRDEYGDFSRRPPESFGMPVGGSLVPVEFV